MAFTPFFTRCGQASDHPILLKLSAVNLTGVPGVDMSQESLVEIRDLNFTYDSRPILTGINMTIPRGKVVAVMGSSGCA
jgi:ABC-type transport system involved in cytochrome bd biosynthesis fused ATPase/permease subunit